MERKSVQGTAAATLTQRAPPKKRENLRPNVKTYLQKGLEVTFISKKQRLQKPK